MEVLKGLPDESVHCCVTSPPYWRQRDYGMTGQLGLEPTPEEYTEKLVTIFREVRRILRTDGTAWVNIGDKWASGGNGGGGSFMAESGGAWAHAKNSKGWRKPPPTYKDKDLVGLPFMVAFAMRADGWFWRQCNVWAKPNAMPESVRDRSTSSHEYVLHFSKRNDYWYDYESTRVTMQPSSETRLKQNIESQAGSARANGGGKTNGPMKAVSYKQDGHSRKHAGFNERYRSTKRYGMGGHTDSQLGKDGYANLRSVWWIAPANYSEGHYAVMPDLLADICITAGCPKGGTVLDPFGGAGTTGLVADRLERNAILIELNPEYAAMAEKRIENDAGMFASIINR